MMNLNNAIIIILLIMMIFLSSCSNNDVQNDYQKCTSVCASVLEEDFVTMNLCMDECKKKFLEEK